MDSWKDVTILSRGGLYTNEDALVLAANNPGAAIRMLNFEVSQFGGYRRISGFEPYDATYPTAPGLGKVLGVWIHNNTVYAARRNSGDETGSLGTNPFAVTTGSAAVTVTHVSHGLAIGSFVTFAGSSTVGGLDLNAEFVVTSTPTANTYTFNASATSDSTTSGGGASVTYSYSYYYSVYRFTAGVGWGADITNGDRSAIGINKLRTTEHSFTGSEVHIVTDGVNRPFRHNGTTYIEIYDRQGTSDTDTEDQLSNIFDTNNGDATVTVTHVGHDLAVGDTVRFSNINVNLGGQNANNKDYTVTVIVDADNYEFELDSVSTVATQNNVGGTAINWFYTLAGTKNIETAKYNTDFRNHIFLAGMSDNPNFLVFSSPNTDLNYQPSGGAGTINVGFTVTGIQKFRDNLYVFGSDRIKRLVGNNSSDFVLQEVTNNIGCIASDSIIEIGGDILFLASDGIRPIQGTARIGDIELETVSKPIQQLLQSLPSTNDLDEMCSVVIRNKTQFRYFFPATTSTADSEGIVGGIRFADQRTGWEFGQLLGIQATVAASGLINNQEVIVHGDRSGNIFKQESGNTFNGSEVISVYATPFVYINSTEKRKVFQHLSIFTRPEGQSTINLGVAFDWDSPQVPRPLTYELTTAGALLRYVTTGGTYDSTFTFDGSSSPVLETNLQGSGRAISLIFTSTGTQAPYSISGFSITYEEAGYR
jgi:hypothetical protein